MPVGKSSTGLLSPGTVRAALGLSATEIQLRHLEACPDIGPACSATELAPYQHDQHLDTEELSLDLEVGVFKRLTLEGVFGLRRTGERIQFLDLAGAPYTPPIADFHHRNETLTGLTDPSLWAHTAFELGAFVGSVRAGVTLPFGFTVENPFALGREGLPHEHLQYGTGTFDPLLGLALDRTFGAVSLSLWTQGRFSVYANRHGYQSGDKLLAALSATRGLGSPRLSGTVGIDAFRETPERWDGIIEREGNLGRTDLIADGTLAYAFAKTSAATLSVKVPFVTVTRGEQARYPGILALGVSTQFP